jgi:uncharacterized protein (DUF433 family)
MERPSLPRVTISLDPPAAPSKDLFQIVQGRIGESLVDALTEKTESILGGAARVARTRIPIWTLEKYRRLGATETQLREVYPTLRSIDIEAAWAYVALNVDKIEKDIAENDAA